MHRTPLAAIVLAVGLLAGACSGGPGPAPAGTASLPTYPEALPTVDFASFRTLLAHLHGRPVVVNIWASWCGPCTAEAPELAAVARQMQGRVQFVGVDILDQLAPARKFIRRYGWPYPSVFDPTASIRNGLGLLGQPATIVYDASGRQVFSWAGPVNRQLLTKELQTLQPA